MSERVIVTGVNGFVGHHVAKQLHERGVEVMGLGNQPSMQPDLLDSVDTYVGCDLTDPTAVACIDFSGVSAIINLAGFANVGQSRDQGDLYTKVNVGVHTTLYEECLQQKVTPRIIAISTGAVYNHQQPLPITEMSQLIEDKETNEYVISKKRMEEAVASYNDKGLHCIIARPFNHTGPGQLPGFLLPDLYEQILAASASGTPMRVGNLDTRRDFTDVRDVARAYIELALADEAKLQHSVYNICSGKSVSGHEILDSLFDAMGLHLQTEVDSTKLRENEVMDTYGSRDRITQDIGWQPEIAAGDMITDFIAWRQGTN